MAEGKHLQIKRGLKSAMGILAAGELGLATDENALYIGDGAANHLIGPSAGSGLTVQKITSATTKAQFLTYAADTSIDVIELGAGTYSNWTHCDIDVDRSSRPLLIRPAPGAAVVFDDTGGMSTDGLFYFGMAALAAYITIEGKYQGGTITVQNYNLGQTAIVNTVYASHITVNGIKVTACTDSADDGWTRWCVYVNSDGTHRSSWLTFNDWEHDSDSGDGFVNHLQIRASSGVDHVTAKGWRVKGGKFGCYSVFDATDITVDDWNMRDVTIPVETNTNTASVAMIRNVRLDDLCGPNVYDVAYVDGGGNSWNVPLVEKASIVLDKAASADEIWSGVAIDGTAGATLAVGDLCYLDVTATEWLLADADAASSAGDVVLGLCIKAATDGNATKMLLLGTMRSAAFPASIALGAPVYVSCTAGDITATQPSGTDDVIRVVGYAITAEPNTIYFNPASGYITHV